MTEQELEKLYTEAYKSVYWTAINLLKNKEEAEDVVQDTFITAYNSYDSLKDKSKAVAWVKKIASNKCLNILTRTRTVNAEDEFLENVEAVSDDFLPASLVESDEKRKIIMDLIKGCLSEESFMTIVLFYFDEMSTKEIADRLNIPQGTVLSRLNYAKKKIKAAVTDYEDKNKDKLFGMGVPFLTLLMSKEAEQLPFKPFASSLLNISASVASTAQGSTAASAGASSTINGAATAAGKAVGGIMIKKAIVGVLAASVLGVGGFAVYNAVNNDSDRDHEAYETVIDQEESVAVIDPVTSDVSSDDTDGTEAAQITETTPPVPVPQETSVEESTMILKERYKLNDNGIWDLVCTYDEEGNVLEFTDYSKSGEIISRTCLFYDENGRVDHEDFYDGTTFESTSFNVYDDNGQLTSVSTVNVNGSEEALTTILDRDADGNTLHKIYANYKRGYTKETTYEYENGLCVCETEVMIYEDSSYLNNTRTVINEYDADGCLFDEKVTCTVNETGEVKYTSEKIYDRDSEGRLTGQTYIKTVDGVSETNSDYEYDAAGSLISDGSTFYYNVYW